MRQCLTFAILALTLAAPLTARGNTEEITVAQAMQLAERGDLEGRKYFYYQVMSSINYFEDVIAFEARRDGLVCITGNNRFLDNRDRMAWATEELSVLATERATQRAELSPTLIARLYDRFACPDDMPAQDDGIIFRRFVDPI